MATKKVTAIKGLEAHYSILILFGYHLHQFHILPLDCISDLRK